MPKNKRLSSKDPADKSKQKVSYSAYNADLGTLKVAEQVSYARLEARIHPELKQRFQQAANIQGRTLTDFMISSLEEVASRTIKQYQMMELSLADQQAFVNALLKPPKPSAQLQRAVKRYKKLGF